MELVKYCGYYWLTLVERLLSVSTDHSLMFVE